MVPIDAHEAEDTLAVFYMGMSASCRLECAYCGGQQSSRNAEEILHAFCEESEIRKRVHAEVESERAKVSRLQEGRW